MALTQVVPFVAPSSTRIAHDPGTPGNCEPDLLLNGALTILDQLWLLRAEQDLDFLRPDHADPGYDCPLSGTPSAAEWALREQLRQIGGQMRRIGLAAVTQAVLARPLPEARHAALLALAGGGEWQAVPDQPLLRQRQAANGQVYLLISEMGGGAAHAPHAIRTYRQSFWMAQDGQQVAAALQTDPVRQREDSLDCLSFDLALRDVAFRLRAEGQVRLAAAVLALRKGSGLVAPTQALVGQSGCLAPAAA